ncbi:snRNA-activating protein complex subunit 4 [Suncus etruscus]|uniref:snRNA-activating protein complex subunit 4 n=1 Tax=Suncus etruscus TaxID=109475 RepID=UPI002110AB83|nr:snRNA-activating protein complex subunit 4 [Suncus etruscus]
MDTDAEREKITREIQELERILEPDALDLSLELSDSSLDLDSDADDPSSKDSAKDAAEAPSSEEEQWGMASEDEVDAPEKALAEDPETCLQLNLVYQEVVRERLVQLSQLLAQNREQQEELTCRLAGSKGLKARESRQLPSNMYVGHFLKPYFKDRVTGLGPPANEDTREKSAQGIKSFDQLLVTKWKSREKSLLRKAVVSDRLQRLLQPKLLKLEYLQQKQSRANSEAEKQVLEKQAKEAEREVQDISQLPEETLLGSRLDSHDWEKISNVNFEGGRGAEEIRKFWQNSEHPSINKQEWSEAEVSRLLDIAAQHGHLHWQKIAEELGTSRSAFQCLQKYQEHNPALKRRQWTEEEDHMLMQLVQEMRVGRHVPYRRIAYYMEGRDSMQLIYRWTKSLDPCLKKGFWTPEEDIKLLQAVAKYGEQDWFKIREEVPGRSDAQCRDRYLRRLHFSLKKGRWDFEEENKLLELIEKHGVGNWAKIASELPQRSGAQCLSKWKVMLPRQRRPRLLRQRPRHLLHLSSSSDSSLDSSYESSEDSEPEDSLESGDGAQEPQEQLPAQHLVPNLDLWMPARRSTADLGGTILASSLAPCGSSDAASTAPRVPPSAKATSIPPGTGIPGSTHAHPTSLGLVAEEPRLRQQLGGQTGPCVAQCRNQTLRKGHTLQQRLLYRQLLTAVSPWVGKVTLPPTPQRPALHTRADRIREQLQDIRLASTPVFTLLIQLLQIDTAGCLEVVQERKGVPKLTHKVLTSAQDTTDSCSPPAPAKDVSKSNDPKGTGMPRTVAPATPSGPRSKSKTVFELLREKRRREARTRRAVQHPAPLLILRPPFTLSTPSPPTPLLCGSRNLLPQAPGLVISASSQLLPGPLGLSQTPITCQEQGLPKPLTFLPATPSPMQLPGWALGVTPAQSIPSAGPHVTSSVPLPATLVLTAQGLLTVPTVVGLPGLAAASDPKGLLLAPLSPLTKPHAPNQLQPPPASTDRGPELPARTEASQIPEVSVAKKLAAPGPLHAATHPEAERPDPPLSIPGEPPTKPPQPLSSEKLPQPESLKGALDLGLLSKETEAEEWLVGQQGLHAAPLWNCLPYQPPELCSLRALARLLLRKAALEHRAAALAPNEALPTTLTKVRARLQHSPAYLLLRSRFLATFALPALLATLPPNGVPTTLSGPDPESEEDEDDYNGLEEQGPPTNLGAATPREDSEDSDDGDVLRTQRTRHARKRKRLV